MGTTHPVVTSLNEQKLQMERPTAEIIWSRAVEVFGSEELAREWMNDPLPILDNETPWKLAESGNAMLQREVLTILGRIDYGMFS